MFIELVKRRRQVAALELQTFELQSLLNRTTDPGWPIIRAAEREAVEQNPQVVDLAKQVNALEIELDILTQEDGDHDGKAKETRARLEATRRKLAVVRDQVLREVLDLEDIREAFHVSQHALQLTQDGLAGAKARQSAVERMLVELDMLREE